MNPRVNKEGTSSGVYKESSIILGLNSNNYNYDGANHCGNKKHDIMGELHSWLPCKTMHQGTPIMMAEKGLKLLEENKVGASEIKISIHQSVVAPRTRMFWTEEEHRLFLHGLNFYGRGKWKSISKYFVTTKTPTQVSSHAQKYFKRLEGKGSKQRYSINDVELVDGNPFTMESNSSACQDGIFNDADIQNQSFLQTPSAPFVTMNNISQF